ncbi:hypothetical protein ABMA28_011205 [Loxostege sticticalis]|uniref:CHK kinase-like domain-containing protein n=1 Tax=Loxostege sticticalis TaxID=481309 RepID=A0ABD0S6L0_LOXSC
MTDAREQVLRELLQKIAAENNYENPEFETVVVPTTGANFSSQLFHATIKSSEKEDINVFAKVLVMGETMRQQFGKQATDMMLNIEPYFYTKLAKKYKEIEDKYDVPDEHRLIVPKYYGHSMEYLKEAVVMQDLSKDGFVTYDRFKSIDWDYASKAIEEMAKLHALSIAHQKEYPDDFEEAKKVLKRPDFEEKNPFLEMFKQGVAKALELTREENRPKITNFFESFDSNQFVKFYMPNKRPAIVHSDYRPSNLLHKIYEDGKFQVVPVDYQSLLVGSVVMDLLYFIFTGSDGAFRAKHYDQLIDYYYENLAAALKRLNLDPEEAFPRTDFDEELKEMLPFGLISSCMLLPVITIDLADVPRGEDGEYESESYDDMFGMLKNANALCEQRVNEVVDDYVRWGIL